MKQFLTILIALCPLAIFAQVDDFDAAAYGRKYLNDLCSERMHGRGYVNNGIQNAATYIQQKFESFQLQNLLDEENSSVTYSVNTFPDKLQLTIDGTQLTAGKDFIIDAISGGGTATLKCIPFNKKDLQDVCSGNNISALKEKYKSKYAQTCLIFDETDTTLTSKQKEIINQWITIDLVWSEVYSIGAIIKITNQKLTQNIASVCGNVPYFIVSDKSLKSKNIKSVSFDVTQKLETVTTNNICYYIDNEKTDKSIFFTAHYDHLGQFGPVTYNGANDNASGVALMLTLAEYFQKHKDEIPVNIYFIAFTGEELGMHGSKAFVNDHLYMNCDGCDFVINLDLVGTGDDGICVVNGKVFDKEMSLIQKINDENNYFKHIQVRGEACNSDHCPFYMKNIPSIYIYTKGGTQAYHDINDNADQLPLTKFNELFNLLVEFVKRM